MAKKKARTKAYDVQPLRTQKEIDDMKWALRRFCLERDVFMFTFGINYGLRVSDIVRLKVGDVRGNQTHKQIVELKTGKIRTINLSLIKDDIDAFTTGMSDDEWLFPSRTQAEGRGHISETQAYRQLVKAGEHLGRKDIGTHTMRKTFGRHYYNRTKNIAVLQEIFNHSTPAITKRYIGITQDDIDESLVGWEKL